MTNTKINKFLKEKYALHKDPGVEHTKERTEKQTGKKINSSDINATIGNFLSRYEIALSPENPKKEKSLKAFKKILFKDNIIKSENIPNDYWELQMKIIRERGQAGDLIDGELANELKTQETERIIQEQKKSLEKWIDYLTDETAIYDTGLKYWVLKSVLGLQSFNKEKQKFERRNKKTISNFPELNREALAYTIDFIKSKIEKENIKKPHEEVNEKDFENITKKENFSDIYSFAIKEVTKTHGEILENTKGEWKKYDKGSDHMPLVKSIEVKATGWCTAGEDTAKKQIEAGDFYVYYSEDEKGKNTIPRIAIRMQNKRIAEIRGIAENQNLDKYIGAVLEEKLEEFGEEGELYKKRASDMKKLTEIEKKHKKGVDLTKEDLSFLYEIEEDIDGFGYGKDPRIEEIQEKRNIKKDLAFLFNCKENQISFNTEEFLNGEDIVYHYGDLDLNFPIKIEKGFRFPENLKKLYLRVFDLPSGFRFPKKLKTLFLKHLEELPPGCEFPKNLDYLHFFNLIKLLPGTSFPENLKTLHLQILEELPSGFEFSENLKKLHLGKLKELPLGFKFPKNLEDLYLDGLKELSSGFEFPESLGILSLYKLKKLPSGFKFPENLYYLSLNGLKELPSGYKFSENLEELVLKGLTKLAIGFEFPTNLRELYLNGLKKIPSGYKFPENLEVLYLSDLQELPSGIKFPENLEVLYLSDLQELPSGIKFPENLEELYLSELQEIPFGVVLPKHFKRIVLKNKTIYPEDL